MDFKDKLIELCFKHIEKTGTIQEFWEQYISPLNWNDPVNREIDSYVVENSLSEKKEDEFHKSMAEVRKRLDKMLAKYVPNAQYLAKLHEGEVLLPTHEVERFKECACQDNQNVNIKVDSMEVYIKKAIEERWEMIVENLKKVLADMK